jgi:hypothetical protein
MVRPLLADMGLQPRLTIDLTHAQAQGLLQRVMKQPATTTRAFITREAVWDKLAAAAKALSTFAEGGQTS